LFTHPPKTGVQWVHYTTLSTGNTLCLPNTRTQSDCIRLHSIRHLQRNNNTPLPHNDLKHNKYTNTDRDMRHYLLNGLHPRATAAQKQCEMCEPVIIYSKNTLHLIDRHSHSHIIKNIRRCRYCKILQS
jgi:hypothetical protein